MEQITISKSKYHCALVQRARKYDIIGCKHKLTQKSQNNHLVKSKLPAKTGDVYECVYDRWHYAIIIKRYSRESLSFALRAREKIRCCKTCCKVCMVCDQVNIRGRTTTKKRCKNLNLNRTNKTKKTNLMLWQPLFSTFASFQELTSTRKSVPEVSISFHLLDPLLPHILWEKMAVVDSQMTKTEIIGDVLWFDRNWNSFHADFHINDQLVYVVTNIYICFVF